MDLKLTRELTALCLERNDRALDYLARARRIKDVPEAMARRIGQVGNLTLAEIWEKDRSRRKFYFFKPIKPTMFMAFITEDCVGNPLGIVLRAIDNPDIRYVTLFSDLAKVTFSNFMLADITPRVWETRSAVFVEGIIDQISLMQVTDRPVLSFLTMGASDACRRYVRRFCSAVDWFPDRDVTAERRTKIRKQLGLSGRTLDWTRFKGKGGKDVNDLLISDRDGLRYVVQSTLGERLHKEM